MSSTTGGLGPQASAPAVAPDARVTTQNDRWVARQDFEHARLATTMGKWRAAQSLLEGCLRAEPDQPEYLSFYGLCLARGEGDLDRALDACREAVALRRYDALLHAHLGHVHLARNAPGIATECFETALSLDPSLDVAQHGLQLLRSRRTRFGLRSLLRLLRR